MSARTQHLWLDLKKQVDERGLALFCSQCDRKAVWYGKGGTAYCDKCWLGDRHEIRRESLGTEQQIID